MYSKEWEFKYETLSPLYPQSNGVVERCFQTVKTIIKKCSYVKTDLNIALLEYRHTPKILIPAELLFQKKLRIFTCFA